MSAAPIEQRSEKTGIAPRYCAGMVGLLLAACIGGQLGSAVAAAALEPSCQSQDESCGEALPLEQLSLTIANLKASLSALRQDLEARRAGGEDRDQAIIDELCAAPLADAGAERDAAISALEQFRAEMESERAAARAAATGAGDELAALRARLANAEAEVARLNEDRARLVSRLEELDATIEKARTTEVVAALAESPPGGPIDAAQAGEPQPDAAIEPRLMLQVAQPGPAALASSGSRGRAAGQRPPPPVDRLQLRAELALAQLKIAELTTALESARLRQEGMEAEVSTLRSLTDAKIRQLMGWQ